jgi:hypothetical protein
MDNSAELRIRDEGFNKLNARLGAFVVLCSVPTNAWNIAGRHSSLASLLIIGGYVIFAALLARAWYVRCQRCRLLVWPTTFVVVNPFRKYELARSDLLGYRHRWLTKRTITYVYVKDRRRGLWLVGLPADRVDELVDLLDIPYSRRRFASLRNAGALERFK